MTPAQFYLGISIPSVIALLGILTSLVTFAINNTLNKRLDDLGHRMDKLDARVDRIENRLESKIDRLGEDYTRFYGEQRSQKSRLDALERQRP